jgi:hypothetical protein
MYTVETNQISHEHVALQMCKNYRQEYLHNVYELPSIEPTIRYLHGVAGFPTKTSWLKAIRKGNHLSWPLINVKNVAKYFPESEETQKGHMRGQRQGVCSTRMTEPTEDKPTNIPHHEKGDIFITEHEVKSLMYADQTGLFQAVSSLGNKYIMILHHVDRNSSWAEAMRSQSGGKLILACACALARMRRRGLIPKHQILDNQASAEYKAAIEATGMTYELVSPEEHRRNMAEKSHPNLQGPFGRSHKRMCPIHADPPLVPISPTSRTTTPSPLSIPSAPNHICIRTCIRTTRLQQTSICPHWHGGPGP